MRMSDRSCSLSGLAHRGQFIRFLLLNHCSVFEYPLPLESAAGYICATSLRSPRPGRTSGLLHGNCSCLLAKMEVAPKVDGRGLVRGGPAKDSGLTRVNHFGIGDGVIVGVVLPVGPGDAHAVDGCAVVRDVEGHRLPELDGELFGLKEVVALGDVEGDGSRSIGRVNGRLIAWGLCLLPAGHEAQSEDTDGQETWELPFQQAFHRGSLSFQATSLLARGALKGDRRYPLHYGDLLQPRPRGTHQGHHVAVRVAVLVHELVGQADLLEGEHPRQAGVDPSLDDHLVEGGALLVVSEVGALETLLAHPQVAQVHHRVVAGGAGADHHHALVVADEDGGGDGVLPRVLEDDAGAPALAENLPQLAAEGARPLRPRGERLRVRPVRQHPPVVEVLAVDATLSPQALAEVELVVAGDDGDGY